MKSIATESRKPSSNHAQRRPPCDRLHRCAVNAHGLILSIWMDKTPSDRYGPANRHRQCRRCRPSAPPSLSWYRPWRRGRRTPDLSRCCIMPHDPIREPRPKPGPWRRVALAFVISSETIAMRQFPNIRTNGKSRLTFFANSGLAELRLKTKTAVVMPSCQTSVWNLIFWDRTRNGQRAGR